MVPVNAWLRATRLRQADPDSGRFLSQERLVDEVNAWSAARGLLNEHGQPWRLHRPNYNGYERESSPKTPEPETLRRFVQFWAERGEPGPEEYEAGPEPVQPPDLATALTALAEELRAMREERAAWAVELAAMREELAGLRGEPLPGLAERAAETARAADELARKAAAGSVSQPRPSALPGSTAQR
jgi:hypothetical protein